MQRPTVPGASQFWIRPLTEKPRGLARRTTVVVAVELAEEVTNFDLPNEWKWALRRAVYSTVKDVIGRELSILGWIPGGFRDQAHRHFGTPP